MGTKALARQMRASQALQRNYVVGLGSQSIQRQQASKDIVAVHKRQLSSSESGQTMEFQAETRKILDIVTNSIYTDKEVFLRELISNASDSLEKYRYMQVNQEVVTDATAGAESTAEATSQGSEINIITDATSNTLTIIDNGIGMNKEELIANLGTIARSGSKAFVQEMEGTESGNSSKEGIIGQFGVGFYSSFMVSDRVSVESISAATATGSSTDSGNPWHRWESDGTGQFTISSQNDSTTQSSEVLSRGSKITMHLKDECKEFSNPERIKEVIKKYSSFVSFPIKVNGEAVNTVSAIWMEEKASVDTKQYNDFYRFISGAFDDPKYTVHFRTDAPIDLKCLFFIPSFHSEKFGGGRTEPGVNLYSRKVLIENKPKDLLPDWLRFVKGVVDSEDLPLSLSREKPQDSRLLARIRDVLTRKLVRYLEEQKKKEPEKFKEFYIEYNFFLKEGVCHDFKFMDQISKLLLFESSARDAGDLISFDDYLSRCNPEQKNVYYLVAPSREAALSSPYYETFKKHGTEVLFLYSTIDDFVMGNVKTFGGRPLVSAETSTVDLSKEQPAAPKKEGEKETSADSKKDEETAAATLSEEEVAQLSDWLKKTLGDRVREVRTTDRLSDSPACVTDHESGALRRMMKMVDQSSSGGGQQLPPQVLEINPSHPIIRSLSAAAQQEGDASLVAMMVAEQVYDNSLIAAGIIDDARTMLPRLNQILAQSLHK